MEADMQKLALLLALCFLTSTMLGTVADQPVSMSETYASLKKRAAFSYQPELPRAVLDRARTVIGDDTRLRLFVRKLIQGQPVKYAVLGSSIATFRGASTADKAWTRLLHKWLEHAFTACGDQTSSKQFLENDTTYVKQHHVCPSSTIEFVDLAIFASTPIFAEKCSAPKIPSDVDLVIIEYAVNDLTYPEELRLPTYLQKPVLELATLELGFYTAERLALERLYRKVLGLPSKPALLLFQAYSWKMAEHATSRFELLPTDYQAIFAQYYGNIQVLSARSVVYHQIRAAMANRNQDFFKVFDLDTTHPLDIGHQIYADIVIQFLQEMVMQELAYSLQGAVQPHTSSSFPPFISSLNDSLPVPLAINNYEFAHGYCSLNQEFQTLVTKSDGFHFTDESTVLSNGMIRHKYGYVARQAGASLLVTLDTYLGGFSATNQVHVMIVHLRSHSHMGKASVTCVSGCTCKPIEIDALTKAKASLTSLADIVVTPDPKCELQITVLNSEQGQRFKVLGIVVHSGAISSYTPYLGMEHDDFIEAQLAQQGH